MGRGSHGRSQLRLNTRSCGQEAGAQAFLEELLSRHKSAASGPRTLTQHQCQVRVQTCVTTESHERPTIRCFTLSNRDRGPVTRHLYSCFLTAQCLTGVMNDLACKHWRLCSGPSPHSASRGVRFKMLKRHRDNIQLQIFRFSYNHGLRHFELELCLKFTNMIIISRRTVLKLSYCCNEAARNFIYSPVKSQEP